MASLIAVRRARGSKACLMHSQGSGGFVRSDILVSFVVSTDGTFRFKALARAINISLMAITLFARWGSKANHSFQRLDTPRQVIDFGYALHQYVHTPIFVFCPHFCIFKAKDLKKTNVIGFCTRSLRHPYHVVLFGTQPFAACRAVKDLLPRS